MLEQVEKRLATAIKNAGYRENFDKMVADLRILHSASDDDVEAPLDLAGQKTGMGNDKKARALINIAKKKASMRDDNDDTRIVMNLHFLRARTEKKVKQRLCFRGGSEIVAARHEECNKRKRTRKHKIRDNKTVSTARAGKTTQFKKPSQKLDFMSA